MNRVGTLCHSMTHEVGRLSSLCCYPGVAARPIPRSRSGGAVVRVAPDKMGFAATGDLGAGVWRYELRGVRQLRFRGLHWAAPVAVDRGKWLRRLQAALGSGAIGKPARGNLAGGIATGIPIAAPPSLGLSHSRRRADSRALLPERVVKLTSGRRSPNR